MDHLLGDPRINYLKTVKTTMKPVLDLQFLVPPRFISMIIEWKHQMENSIARELTTADILKAVFGGEQDLTSHILQACRLLLCTIKLSLKDNISSVTLFTSPVFPNKIEKLMRNQKTVLRKF